MSAAKNIVIYIAALTTVMLGIMACSTAPQRDIVKENFDIAAMQYEGLLANSMKGGVTASPSAFINGEIDLVPIGDWTSGFFAGALWTLYEYSGDERWHNGAIKYTELLSPIQHQNWHHDVGFIINSSYGNAINIGKISQYEDVIITAAESLSSRYNPNTGTILSWNADRGWQADQGWHNPVIINGLMNLEILFKASELSGDDKYKDIAISHVDKTIEFSMRNDGSTYQIVDYDPQSGDVIRRCSSHGVSVDSTWSRGQAWAIYGLTMCYRYTHDERYLTKAQQACRYYFKNKNLPEDMIPYWDFDAPNIPNEQRDASSAAITASALYELYYHTQNKSYRQWGNKIISSLSSEEYRSPVGEGGGFILKHSVSCMPLQIGVDEASIVTDYYFLEALLRRSKIETNHNLF